MGNTIDKVDEGLYICGADALGDFERLDRLGIKCILNAASVDLYRNCVRGEGSAGSGRLMQLLERYEVKALECQDNEQCNLSVHFDDLAEFVEEGRRKGGVAIHCAAGISRATTSTCAYLMIKEHYDLESAFLRVHSVRSCVHPNAGFWRQLRDLEAVLRARGIQLESREPPPRPIAEEPSSASGRPDPSSFGRDRDPRELIKQMDEDAQRKGSFGTHYLTVRIGCSEGAAANDLEGALRTRGVVQGITWENLEVSGDDLRGRAKCVPSMDGASLQALLAAVPGVAAAEVEDNRVSSPP